MAITQEPDGLEEKNPSLETEAPELSKEATARIDQALQSLDPLLRDALQNEMVASGAVIFPYGKNSPAHIVLQNEFQQQDQLLKFIDSFNGKMREVMRVIEDPSERIWGRIGKDLINYIAVNAPLLLEGGVMGEIMVALKVIVRTKIREAAKKASSTSFIPDEFKRERILHEVMNDFERLDGHYGKVLSLAAGVVRFRS